MRRFLDGLVFTVAAFLMSAAVAATPLSSAQVENYIASFAEAQTFAEENPLKQKGIDRDRPLVSSVDLLAKDSLHYQGLSKIAQKYHFRNLEQWADVGDRVMNAYFIAKEGSSLEFIKRHYEEAEARINNNPDYSKQFKKDLLAGMEKGYLRNVKKTQNAQPDLPAVTDLMDQIAPLYK
ncbi:MAG TPA: hypothetical protein VJY83_09760 [Thiopseudomonas sp.]|nr:hypothetical protein [Thiopseudomonas sp.]